MCTAVVFFVQFFEQPHHIGLGIVPIGVGVAGGVHTGTSVEGSHFQTGVVGKNVKSVAFVDIAGFSGMSSWQSMSASERMSKWSPTMAVIS